MTENRMLKAKELGLLLALSQRQIHRLIASGKIPQPVRIGGAIRWDSQLIENWIAQGCPDRSEFEAQIQGKGESHA